MAGEGVSHTSDKDLSGISMDITTEKGDKVGDDTSIPVEDSLLKPTNDDVLPASEEAKPDVVIAPEDEADTTRESAISTAIQKQIDAFKSGDAKYSTDPAALYHLMDLETALNEEATRITAFVKKLFEDDVANALQSEDFKIAGESGTTLKQVLGEVTQAIKDKEAADAGSESMAEIAKYIPSQLRDIETRLNKPTGSLNNSETIAKITDIVALLSINLENLTNEDGARLMINIAVLNLEGATVAAITSTEDTDEPQGAGSPDGEDKPEAKSEKQGWLDFGYYFQMLKNMKVFNRKQPKSTDLTQVENTYNLPRTEKKFLLDYGIHLSDIANNSANREAYATLADILEANDATTEDGKLPVVEAQLKLNIGKNETRKPLKMVEFLAKKHKANAEEVRKNLVTIIRAKLEKPETTPVAAPLLPDQE